MGALLNTSIMGFDIPSQNTADREATLMTGKAGNQEATMATVMMTRLDDSSIQMRFHRLLLMAENDKILSTHPLTRRITYIGRSRRNHVKAADPLVSTRHLTVSVSGDTCTVNDLDSTNGTFINGERLVGSQVLNHGDEILFGKTVLRFAARQAGAPDLARQKAQQQPVSLPGGRRGYLLAAAFLILALSVGLVYEGTRRAGGLFAGSASLTAGDAPVLSPPTSGERTLQSRQTTEAATQRDSSRDEARPGQPFHIQRALEAYAAGQSDEARQILGRLALARQDTPEAFQAQSILAMIDTVEALHVRALRAGKQKRFAEAIECWDRLLTADTELVGDRPSYFSAQAELQVQSLSYEYALDAFRTNNYPKARQLCHLILQINPDHRQALALLAKIDRKA